MIIISKKTAEEVMEGMNEAARLAREDFDSLKANSDKATFEAISGLLASWWDRWYLTAGHKRLAYILMGKKMKGE